MTIREMLIMQESDKNNVYKLTDRQIEIAIYIKQGFTDNQIAEILQISRSTVRSHITNGFNKVGVMSRIEFVTRLIRNGYMEA